MVKKSNKKTDSTTKPVAKKTTDLVQEIKTEMSKVSPKRALLTGVMLVVTAAIWYQVGAVVFGFTSEKSQVPVKKIYSNETVVAEIDGSLVKLKDVRSFVKDIPQLAELPFEEIYPQVLDNMINTRVLLKGAEKTAIQEEPEVKKALKMAKEQILSQAYLSKQVEAEMTPENLQALYMEEMQNYERPEEMRARHILVETRKEAEDIIVQLKAGADFKKLADKKSLDVDNKGGDLGGYFTQNMMIPEVGKAVFALKKGELSGPIKTPFGWHVVLVEDKRLAEPPAFEDVQEQLKQIYAERNIQNVLENERKKVGVKIYQPTLK